MDAFIDRGPIEGDWAPGYYYVVFEDPDGIRLEVNYLPGKGLLAGEQPSARATTRTGSRTLKGEQSRRKRQQRGCRLGLKCPSE